MKWNTIPSEETITKTAEAIKKRGIAVIVVDTVQEALETVKKQIPANSSVMNGSSTTLKEIGLVEYLKSKDLPWDNLHAKALAQKDQAEQMEHMRLATTADYFLGSVNAIAESGELLAADASGSRVGAYPFAAKHVLLVAGVNKIVASTQEGIQRIKEYVLPLESERVKKEMGMPGSMIGKLLIVEHEMFPNRTILVLVKQKLGF